MEKPDVWERNVSLSSITTLRIGGVAEYLARILSVSDLRSAVSAAKERGLPVAVIGGGSNILAPDDTLKGLVLTLSIAGVVCRDGGDSNSVLVTAGAGVVFDDLVRNCVREELWGLENLSGIPGTVGGAPIQNIGAYGVEVKDCVSAVVAYDMVHDCFMIFSNKSCAFSYRDSFFKSDEGKRFVITHVQFRLSRIPRPQCSYDDLRGLGVNDVPPSIQVIRESVLRIRARKFPDFNTHGTAGSFFKNPIVPIETYERLREQHASLPGYPHEGGVKIPLAYLLDKILGLRGYRRGDVGLYEHQALVLVNHGSATAREVRIFSDEIITRVKKVFDITIDREVTELRAQKII